MEPRELALIALRVLSGCTHGQKETDDVKTLRANCEPEERSLPTDELACVLIGRCCAAVTAKSKADRKVVESSGAYLEKIG
jgi:hypothetical protein